jgi:hypothetical protein
MSGCWAVLFAFGSRIGRECLAGRCFYRSKKVAGPPPTLVSSTIEAGQEIGINVILQRNIPRLKIQEIFDYRREVEYCLPRSCSISSQRTTESGETMFRSLTSRPLVGIFSASSPPFFT